MPYHEKTVHAAKGKWKGVLLHLGVPRQALSGKHCPCPLCGGDDRFRFDDKDGSGSYICSGCGAGYGIQLAEKFTGKGFADVARDIDQIVGNVTADTPRPKMSDDDHKRLLRETYANTKPIETGDLADTYLRSRKIDELIYPPALRFGRALRDGEGGLRPAMVALVGVHGDSDAKGRQKYVSMHRTFLKPDGSGKAEMARPRKMMPGELPDGACVMLSEWSGGPLGVAEGIETAMAASALYDMPVWATINTAMMKRWAAPEGCNEVHIFGDNDKRFAGQAAAYHLAHRLACRDVAVTVSFPAVAGTDYWDEWDAR